MSTKQDLKDLAEAVIQRLNRITGREHYLDNAYSMYCVRQTVGNASILDNGFVPLKELIPMLHCYIKGYWQATEDAVPASDSALPPPRPRTT